MIISFEKSEWVEMVEKMCDEYCKMPDICATQERLDRHCEECPMNTVEYPLGYCPHQE